MSPMPRSEVHKLIAIIFAPWFLCLPYGPHYESQLPSLPRTPKHVAKRKLNRIYGYPLCAKGGMADFSKQPSKHETRAGKETLFELEMPSSLWMGGEMETFSAVRAHEMVMISMFMPSF